MAGLPPPLPFEIITEILSRLPVKPLLRFKCVCKSWRYLIFDDPQFAKLHLQHAKQDANLIHHKLFLLTLPLKSIDLESYCNDDGNIVTRELDFPPGNPDISVELELVESCDGLISFVFDSKIDPQIIVWNPATDESRHLPPISFPDSDIVFFGFGYDSSTHDYKIVRGSSSRSIFASNIELRAESSISASSIELRTESSVSASSIELRMEIFSLKGLKWRTIHCPVAYCPLVMRVSAAFLNGVFYWTVTVDKGNVIASFDLAEEKFLEMIPVPEHVPLYMDVNLKVLGDSLCAYAVTWTYWEAWIIEGHGTKASWSRLFSGDSLPRCQFWLDLIWVAKNGNIVFNLDGLELVLFNPNEQTSQQYRVPSERDGFLATTYIESLISPNAREG